MKKPALWVAFKGHLNNGMVMAADGLFPGDWPLNVPTLLRIKSEIKEQLDKQAAGIRPVDQKGNMIINGPKPAVQMVELCSIAPAEVEMPDVANDAAPIVIDEGAQGA